VSKSISDGLIAGQADFPVPEFLLDIFVVLNVPVRDFFRLPSVRQYGVRWRLLVIQELFDLASLGVEQLPDEPIRRDSDCPMMCVGSPRSLSPKTN